MSDAGFDAGADIGSEVGLDKSSLRKEMLSRRDRIPPEVRGVKNRLILANVETLEEFISSKVIFTFASFRSEVDTTGIIRLAFSSGKRVVLPRVEGQDLGLFEIRDLAELAPGYMKIPEPSGLTDERRVGINDVDAVIIPGAAFDVRGNRIGYGGGYYDRLLAGLRKSVVVIAPAYEEQIVEAVPTDEHDKKVNILVTDRRVIRCGTVFPG